MQTRGFTGLPTGLQVIARKSCPVGTKTRFYCQRQTGFLQIGQDTDTKIRREPLSVVRGPWSVRLHEHACVKADGQQRNCLSGNIINCNYRWISDMRSTWTESTNVIRRRKRIPFSSVLFGNVRTCWSLCWRYPLKGCQELDTFLLFFKK